MKNTLSILAVVILVASATGCGSCRGLFGSKSQTCTTPVYSQCAPMCAPACSTGCNTCNTCDTGCNTCCPSDGGVTYGFDGTGYAPESMPMMVPATN